MLMKILPLPPLLIALTLVSCVHGQVTTPCTATMLSSVSPCMSFLSNSSSPTAACCNSLKSLADGCMNCLCLIFAGGGPFSVPINRSLAITLPRACNMPGVPVQCKASSAPALAPESSSSPTASLVPEPTPSASALESQTIPTSGSSPMTDLSNSAAVHSINLSPAVLLSAIAFLVCKFY